MEEAPWTGNTQQQMQQQMQPRRAPRRESQDQGTTPQQRPADGAAWPNHEWESWAVEPAR
ncbi:uncharacterized protein ColSpa_10596 [Colletotrichum spaethianum]|uniref:Uncharacterized protein n=1 Tax=Colletotrichum spaethianum TaxID=700344 RepID=A0AA37UPD4_9PEZI|nr:uncharacterized protein ColSpa_10596 [Colletotrichum spaethianum]GKT50415.1 hypothetical protein ColSpa_10596 [Colletotrichum spaethianum]